MSAQPTHSAEHRAEQLGSPLGVAHAAGRVLDQCAGVLHDLTDEQYTRPSRRTAGASIGQHVRHTLDHFSATLRAVEGEVIDYDQRQRGTSVEQHREEAIRRARQIAETFADLTEHDAARPVRVRVMLSAAGDDAELPSTLGREIAFASHHAVHHHAMIISIASEFGLQLPADFGKAPSTLNHERAAR